MVTVPAGPDASVPRTSCDEPYIGEESIRRPPPSRNARRTSVRALRAATSSPTLNVIQLPSPTSGSFSPLERIGRVRMGDRAAVGARGRRTETAPAVAREVRSVRRVNVRCFGIG